MKSPLLQQKEGGLHLFHQRLIVALQHPPLSFFPKGKRVFERYSSNVSQHTKLLFGRFLKALLRQAVKKGYSFSNLFRFTFQKPLIFIKSLKKIKGGPVTWQLAY